MPDGSSVSPNHSPERVAETERAGALFARLRQGDAAAFDAIFREWYGTLVGVAQRLLRDRAVAEEVVQDVMLELWRRRAQLTVDDSPRAYLIRATRNRALNHLRHLRVEQRGAPYAAGPTEAAPLGASAVVEDELGTALAAAVAELPARCREVFELSRVQGLSYAEIAGVLAISTKTVENQMGKALRVLRGRLAAWLPGGDAAQ
jgi:RNA polymerase sigma-70 factor (ECF subfamily)